MQPTAWPNVRYASNTNRSHRNVAMCQNVWPGRAVQDGFPRATNVRAASMYQVSSWSIFCSGPSWVSARIQA